MTLALTVILVVIMLVALLSRVLDRWKITVPMALVLAGVIVGWGTSTPLIENMDNPWVERAVEVILALLLFLDATELKRSKRRDVLPLVRVVALGVPLCLLVTAVAAMYVFPDEHVALCLVLACIIVPTDMAPAAGIVSDSRIPSRLRNLLNTESGYNDGIVAPIFLFATEFLKHTDGGHADEALAEMFPAAVSAVGIGLVVGALSAWLAGKALSRGLTTTTALGAAILAVPLLAYTITVGEHGNGFIAAFVAGLAFRAVYGRLEHAMLSLSEGVAHFVAMPLWFIIGQLLVLVLTLGDGEVWRAAGLALLGLTVLRVLPILLVLTPSTFTWGQRLLIGWLGPRGIASVVFMLLALPAVDDERQVILLIEVMVFTVVGSVVLHGLSAPLIARRLEKAGYVDEDALDDAGRPLHLKKRPDGSTGATRYTG